MEYLFSNVKNIIKEGEIPMKIRVRFFSSLKLKAGKEYIDLNVPENANIGMVVEKLGEIYGQDLISVIVNKEKSGYNVVFMLNKRLLSHDDYDDVKLKENDILSMLLPISGGC